MGLLNKDIFVCIDCEATGLDTERDQIIEVAYIIFTFDEVLDSFETLIKPTIPIPDESRAIHHISDEMVDDKPRIQTVLPDVLKAVGNYPIMGHGIAFDIALLDYAAKKYNIDSTLTKNPSIDTLRLARLYGESPSNSLETLRKHFNVTPHGAHRAMNDVIVNIEVFKHLTKKFKSTGDVIRRLQKPIAMKRMPLGKHKGRLFSELPIEYLKWASHQKFDQDLLYSLRLEIKARKHGNTFSQAGNPFSTL